MSVKVREKGGGRRVGGIDLQNTNRNTRTRRLTRCVGDLQSVSLARSSNDGGRMECLFSGRGADRKNAAPALEETNEGE